MKLKVTFREYTPPYIDPETDKEERGEFLGSFKKTLEGESVIDIIEKAEKMAAALSKESGNDVRFWEIPARFTPRGIEFE